MTQDGTPPLGSPNQINKLPTLPSDRADEIQRAFVYQWAVGVIFLAGGMSGTRPCQAIWCEHHDDLLLERTDDKYDAVQVKTASAENAVWRVTDAELIGAIKRFCRLEDQHSEKISSYIFYSNAKPYIPADTALKDDTLKSSPVRLRHCCREESDVTSLPSPYREAFVALVAAAQATPDILHRVLVKLEFIHGPALRGYEDLLVNQLSTIPSCEKLTLQRLIPIRDELLHLVGKAFRLSVTSSDLFLSVLGADGKPAAEIRSKRVSIEDAQLTIGRSTKEVFRYSDMVEHLPYGTATGQLGTLRKKMRAGYVESYFETLSLHALSAEARMLGRASADPERFASVANQLEAVTLTLCKEAELMAALENDERRKGVTVLHGVINTCKSLAKDEPEKVEGEPYETLLGLAGLLSGQCKFAWGADISKESTDGS